MRMPHSFSSASRGPDGRLCLTPALLEFYGRTDVAELNRSVTSRTSTIAPSDRPRVARTVLAVAAAGDAVAQAIVTEQGRRLAMYAQVAALRSGLAEGKVSVVLSGSVPTAEVSQVAAALLTALRERLPEAVPHRAALPPVAGAALDALGEAGIEPTVGHAAELAASLPPPEFWAT
ncbi:hypothetical protein [Saccharopolyspora pogona]|uniref:hypothetical protein n=1 Tax=Saccharopolyspora pogona TaxID=333966 RepID=UPI00168859B8|nr:hypothetical protein [Saccharopolyspora pogona]